MFRLNGRKTKKKSSHIVRCSWLLDEPKSAQFDLVVFTR